MFSSLMWASETPTAMILKNPMPCHLKVHLFIDAAIQMLTSLYLCFLKVSYFFFLSHTDYIDQGRRDAVFQFGVLILELVTGQSLGDEDELVQWVQESGFAYSMHKMVDADLGDNYDSKQLKSLLIIARLCTRSADGPVISIPQILRYLQGKVEPPVPSVWLS